MDGFFFVSIFWGGGGSLVGYWILIIVCYMLMQLFVLVIQ